MRREGLTPKADATTNHNGANKARNAGIDVHDRAAGKVEGSLASQPANGCRNAIDFGLSGGFIRIACCGGKLCCSVNQSVWIRHAPNPVRHGEVDHCHPEQHKEKDGRELHALCKCANDQRWRDHGEGHLEHHEGIFRDDVAWRECWRNRRDRDAFEENLIQAANIRAKRAAIAKGDRVAINSPNHADERDNRKCLRKDGEHVFCADQTAIKQGQSWN